jgi:competence protein ComEA
MAKKRRINPEIAILVAVVVLAAAVIGYIIKNQAEAPEFTYSIGDTASERIKETISLQNELLGESNTSSNNSTASGETQSVVNINTATKAELMALTGIGEAKAKAIIDYRNENGNFSSTEEIMNVSGIGEKIYEKIKNRITVK